MVIGWKQADFLFMLNTRGRIARQKCLNIEDHESALYNTAFRAVEMLKADITKCKWNRIDCLFYFVLFY